MASAPGEEEAADPFGFIDRECGPLSSSLEERLFRLSPFLNDNPPLPPPSPLPPADAPILICSLPDDEQSPPPPPPPPPPPQPQDTNNNNDNKRGESSSKQQTPATTSTKTKKKRRRLMGAQLRTSSSEADDQEELTQPPPEPPAVAPPPPDTTAATTTTRKLPESILKRDADRRDVSGRHSREEAADVAPCDLVVTLEDVVRKYSRQPDTAYDRMSLLEVAEMRGFLDRPS